MSIKRDFSILTPAERSLWRYPMMWISAAAIAAVPLLYAGINLGSTLDPYGNLGHLPVALVNLDEGATVRGETHHLGDDTVRDLRRAAKFAFRTYPDEGAARAAVRRGDAYFALTIPKNFSKEALTGDSSRHGKLNFYVAEGSSYFAGRVANSFATTLADELNRQLGEHRWNVVQTSLRDVQKGFADIRAATGRLRDGAETLRGGTADLRGGAADLARGASDAADGSAKFAGGAADVAVGVTRLTGGDVRLGAALRQLEAAAPGAEQLAPLQTGAARLQSGAGDLAAALGRLSEGTSTLTNGARDVQAGAARVRAGSAELASQLPALQSGLGSFASGAGDLAVGAKRADEGAARLHTGAAELATQLPRLRDGLTSGSAALAPLAEGANAAATGASRLAEGAAQLAGGTARLQEGTAALAAGLREAQTGGAAATTGARQLAQGTAPLADGAAKVTSGAATLAEKTAQAAVGARDLADGARTLRAGVDRAVTGNVRIKDALGDITRQLPASRDLDRLDDGASTLAGASGDLTSGLRELAAGADRLAGGTASVDDGATKLADGLARLHDEIPKDVEQLGGDPAGLSASVEPVVRAFAPVKNNGTGFAPYFMAMALWIGVTLTAFIFPYQQLPESGRRTRQLARMLRKAAAPALLVTAQALLVVWGVHLLGVEYVHPLQVTFTAVASSLTFLSAVLALIFLFGAAGRLFAVILLILQLAASGGSFPVEVAPAFFQDIHAYTPVTYTVNALRHAITGAFEGQYGAFMLKLSLFAGLGVLLGLLGRRRWEFVDDEAFKPLISAPMTSQPVHHEAAD